MEGGSEGELFKNVRIKCYTAVFIKKKKKNLYFPHEYKAMCPHPDTLNWVFQKWI